MPNRIIKESVCASDEINLLEPFEEVMFYRLIVNCDDYGRFDGRALILKGRLFPLKDVSTEEIDKALCTLAGVGLIDVYIAEGRRYVQIKNWAKHQQVRCKKAKYPAPQGESSVDINLYQVISDDTNLHQTEENDIICVTNPIQSESQSEYESEYEFLSESQSQSQSESEVRDDTDAEQAYENLFGNITPMVSEMLNKFDVPLNVKISAIEKAHANNARAPLRYIEAILNNHLSSNVKSTDKPPAISKGCKAKSASDSSYDWEEIEREEGLRAKKRIEKMLEEERREKERAVNSC